MGHYRPRPQLKICQVQELTAAVPIFFPRKYATYSPCIKPNHVPEVFYMGRFSNDMLFETHKYCYIGYGPKVENIKIIVFKD